MEAQRPIGRAATPQVVLIVEDDPDFRELLKLILLPLDIAVVAVGKVEYARSHLNERLALVILDFYLEPRVGTELLDDIPTGVPVLLLTASLETRELLRKYPRISKALQKPVSGTQLQETVRSLLGDEGRPVTE